MPNLVGIGNSQVPTNAMLGGLAYQDPAHANLTNVEIENIAKIKAKTSDNAVDVFVYDTRKDSDGGAWRKRTSHTSWYNEKPSATRGARKEFPAVAVLVVTGNADSTPSTLVIYDGDDPNMSMWMQYNRDTTQDPFFDYSTPGSNHWGNYEATSVSAFNGIICVGTYRSAGHISNLNAGVREFHFIEDACYATNNDKRVKFPTHIADRYVVTMAYDEVTPGNALFSSNVRDVEMTVLPDAEIDKHSGLPIPTIVAALDAGVSVITSGENGKIYDIQQSLTWKNLNISEVKGRKVVAYTYASGGTVRYTYIDKVARDGGNDRDFEDYPFNSECQSSSPAPNGQAFGNRLELNRSYAGAQGLAIYNRWSDPGEQGNSRYDDLLARITTYSNSGWMHGDVKGAWMGSNDDTDLSGTNLVTNGDFSSNANGWSIGGTNWSSFSIVNGRLRMTNQNNQNGFAYQDITVVVGRTYVLTCDCYKGTNAYTGLQVNSQGGGSVSVSSGQISTDGRYTLQFVADHTTVRIFLGHGSTGNGEYTEADNVSLVMADLDSAKILPSGNCNPLRAVGTITKTRVASGSDLVMYGFGNHHNNYLRNSYSTALDFGSGHFSAMVWFKMADTGQTGFLFDRCDAANNNRFCVYTENELLKFYTKDGNGASEISASIPDRYDGQWIHCVVTRFEEGLMEIYTNGLMATRMSKQVRNITNTSGGIGAEADMIVGGRFNNASSQHHRGEMTLLRMSASCPTEEQVKKIYADEKKLFAENAKCTLYGLPAASYANSVTAIAYDDSTDILHVGTSKGRSDIRGLTRINNTTTAVTTAISASNGLIAEQ